MVRCSMRALTASLMRRPLVTSNVMRASERGPSARATRRSCLRSSSLRRLVACSSSARGRSTVAKGAVHGPLAGGVDVEAVERRGAPADAGGRQAFAVAGVALLGAEAEVGVGVMDAGGQWSHPNPLAEGEPGFEVGAVGGAGVGGPLGEQEAAHEVVGIAQALGFDGGPVSRSVGDRPHRAAL